MNALHAMVDACKRLAILQAFSIRVNELGSITIKAPELWEPKDQQALDQLDIAIAEAQGELPLFIQENTYE